MSKPAETIAPQSTQGTVWISSKEISRNTEAPRIEPDQLLYSRARAGFLTEPLGVTGDGNVLTIRSDDLDAESPIMPLSTGKRRIEATVLESDEVSVFCELNIAEGVNAVSLPRNLVPDYLGFGAPIWISIDESVGSRRFVVTSRDADPDRLAEGVDEVDALVESLKND